MLIRFLETDLSQELSLLQQLPASKFASLLTALPVLLTKPVYSVLAYQWRTYRHALKREGVYRAAA
jgi:hypothetical protein